MKKDKIMLSPMVDDRGLRQFVREMPDGTVEEGLIGGPEHMHEAEVAVKMRRTDHPFEFEVAEEYRFNSRGSTGAATNAYRSGWDQTFSRVKGKHAPN